MYIYQIVDYLVTVYYPSIGACPLGGTPITIA
jgi:hypothetical protein